VYTRTVISQAHRFQWLGSFGNRGNGRYREELRQALSAIGGYQAAHQLPKERARLWLDGQYGTGAVLSDLAGFAFVTRGKEYTVLDHPLVQARLHLPPDQLQQRRESQSVRSLYDCPQVPVGPIQPATGRVRWASRGQGLSTNCSSRICPSLHSPLAMWSNCICIAAPLNRRLPTKIRRSTPIGGVVTARAVRRHGVS
jgi:hypothetical protein